jgi:hypothetical protein
MRSLKAVIPRDVKPYSVAHGYKSSTPMQFQNLQDKMGESMLTHNVHNRLPDYRRYIPQVRGVIFNAVIISTLLLEFTSQNQKYKVRTAKRTNLLGPTT